MKNIQSNFQSFRNIVKGDFVYADKTESVYQLATKGGAYFLSRPRKFGRSLLLNTFDALFREPATPEDAPSNLFKNLWIGQKATPAYDFTDWRPVINLSLSMPCQSPQILSDEIALKIRRGILLSSRSVDSVVKLNRCCSALPEVSRGTMASADFS